MTADVRSAEVPRTARWAGPAILAVGLALSGGAATLVQGAVANDQSQLLMQRASEVKESLLSGVQAQAVTLSTLGAFVDHHGAADPAAFRQMAPVLLNDLMPSRVGLVTAGTTLKLTASVGALGGAGATLTPAAQEVLRRSLATGQLATGISRQNGATHVILAVPASKKRAAVFQEIGLDAALATSTPDSPYGELRAAVYANAVDAEHLVFATDAASAFSKDDLRVTIPVGGDSYVLVVGTKAPLGGGIAGWMPWLVLGGGIALTLLVAATAITLTRRRAYALALVETRTRELRVLNDFLEQVLSRGPMVVLRGQVIDGVPTTTYASANAASVLGIPPEDLVAAGAILPWVHPEDAPAVVAGRARLAGESGHQIVEFRVLGGDGETRWARSLAVHQVDSGTGTGAYAIYLTDTTAERGAQQVLREAADTAERANRSKTQFLSRMSHELRTPLNAIIGFGQLAVSGSSGEARDDAEQIVKAGQHLLGLINEVLELTGIESGGIRLSPEPIAVCDVIREAIDLIRPIADRGGIQVVAPGCDCAAGPPYAFADRQRTKQVVLNLLSNAVKYNRTAGSVSVSCTEVAAGADGATGRLLIQVSDTGPGIPPEAIDAAFAPFERLGAANSAVEGSGIGLSLSRHLAEVMNGTLTASSVVGQGSTFTLELPAAEGPLERLDRLEAAGPALPKQARATSGTVLYIEDNLPNLRLIERVLGRRPGIELITSMQGRLGLELTREHRPMLVLLDLHLADIDGEQVLAELLADPTTRDIPVVILSADATPGVPARLLAAGAAAYLTKPIDIEQLLRLADDAAERTVPRVPIT